MPQENEANRTRWILGLGAFAIALTLAAGGYWFYCHQVRAIRSNKYEDLKAIADLKTGQLVSWRQERLADARMNATGTVRTLFLKWLASPADSGIKSAIHERLRLYAELEGYENMIIARSDGRLLFSLDPRLHNLEANTRQFVSQSLAAGGAVFSDFFRCPACNAVHLDVAMPIADEAGRPVSVLIQRINPEQYLYPLIQSWPTSSKSAETLLVRREGDSVLYLNKLRHRNDPPLTIRLPLSRTDVPAVQAVSGQTGETTGVDYRGRKVFADIRPVPDTSWFLVAKVDEEEVLADIRFHGLGILSLVGLGILMTAAIAANIFNQRQRHFYQRLFKAEQQRRQMQEEIRATLYGIGDGVIATDAQGRITRMNPVAEQLTGWTEAEALGQPLPQVFHIINEETRLAVESPVERVLREGMIVGLANHTVLISRAGGEMPVADSGAPIRNPAGEAIGAVLVFRDQTEERAALARLTESEERYRILFEGSCQGILIADVETRRFLYANPAICRMFGYAAAEMIGLSVEDIHPADSLEQVLAEFAHQAKGDHPLAHALPCLRKDKSIFQADISASPMVINSRQCAVGFFQDITDRQKLEEQLRQAQKIEAVGQLAGGVAHDFNNMLMVILGHADLALARLDASQPLFANLQEIRKAAQRSAAITRQLLAFARKQTVMLKVLDLNETIAGMLKMLQRLIGENIALTFKPGSSLWLIKIDPAQIDQILANLTVNARDAIAGSGEITIETGNIELDASYSATHADFVPGAYVLLAVSDNGSGMDKQTFNHLFEPFFTTKALGKGTGLGLATVYGIVKQNKGFINVYSEPGQGTTFKIYLPREQPRVADEPPAVIQDKPIFGNETILLVEDEEAILNLGQGILEQCGYTVLAARTPAEALALISRHKGTIHLLVTDVILPGMNGRELQQRLAQQRPELKVLYMSGYTADVIARHGVLDPGIAFLQKPFSVLTLAEKVREVLDARGEGL